MAAIGVSDVAVGTAAGATGAAQGQRPERRRRQAAQVPASPRALNPIRRNQSSESIRADRRCARSRTPKICLPRQRPRQWLRCRRSLPDGPSYQVKCYDRRRGHRAAAYRSFPICQSALLRHRSDFADGIGPCRNTGPRQPFLGQSCAKHETSPKYQDDLVVEFRATTVRIGLRYPIQTAAPDLRSSVGPAPALNESCFTAVNHLVATTAWRDDGSRRHESKNRRVRVRCRLCRTIGRRHVQLEVSRRRVDEASRRTIEGQVSGLVEGANDGSLVSASVSRSPFLSAIGRDYHFGFTRAAGPAF